MLKFLQRRPTFMCAFWLIISLVAILKLPNLTNLLTQHTVNPISYSQSWGSRLHHAERLEIVYHSHRKITDKQQMMLNAKLTQLKYHQRHYGIHQIKDLNHDVNGKQRYLSADQTTEIVTLAVNPKYFREQGGRLRKRLARNIQVSGLTQHFHSPQITVETLNQHRVQALKALVITGILIMSSGLGILTRSWILGSMAGCVLLLSFLDALSLIANLVVHHWLALNQLTPVATCLTVLLTGGLMLGWLFLKIIQSLKHYRHPQNAILHTYQALNRPLFITGLVISGSFLLPKFILGSPTANLWATNGITLLVIFSVMLTFLPGGLILTWPLPNHRFSKLGQNPVSSWLHGFGQRHFISGFFLLIVFISLCFGNVFFTRHPASGFSKVNQSPGEKIITKHFNPGRAEPILLDLHRTDPLTQEADFKTLDELTQKLQQFPGVLSVASVTQPGAKPEKAYYLKSQLNDLAASLADLESGLATMQKELAGTTWQSEKMPALQKLEQQLDATDHIVDKLPGPDELHAKKYRKLVQDINSTQAALMHTTSKTRSQTQQLQKTLQKCQQMIIKAQKNLNVLNASTSDIKTAVNDLATSSAGQTFHLSNELQNDTNFQQSKRNFMSQNLQNTRLEIIYQHPDRFPYQSFRQQANAELQGTPLQKTQRKYQGLPVQQAQERQERKSSLQIILISLSILLGGLILISRRFVAALIAISLLGLSNCLGITLLARFQALSPEIIFTSLLILNSLLGADLLRLSWHLRQHNHLTWHPRFMNLRLLAGGIITLTLAPVFSTNHHFMLISWLTAINIWGYVGIKALGIGLIQKIVRILPLKWL